MGYTKQGTEDTGWAGGIQDRMTFWHVTRKDALRLYNSFAIELLTDIRHDNSCCPCRLQIFASFHIRYCPRCYIIAAEHTFVMHPTEVRGTFATWLQARARFLEQLGSGVRESECPDGLRDGDA